MADAAWPGKAGHDSARQARQGLARHVAAWLGMADATGQGAVRHGLAGQGSTWQTRQGAARQGQAGRGRHGKPWQGSAWRVAVRLGMA